MLQMQTVPITGQTAALFLMDFKTGQQKSSALQAWKAKKVCTWRFTQRWYNESQRVEYHWYHAKTSLRIQDLDPKKTCFFFRSIFVFFHQTSNFCTSAENHIINWHVSCNIHHRKLCTFTVFHLFSSLASLTTSRRVGSSPAHASKRWMKDCRPWGKLNRRRKRNLERSTTKWISSDFIFLTFP